MVYESSVIVVVKKYLSLASCLAMKPGTSYSHSHMLLMLWDEAVLIIGFDLLGQTMVLQLVTVAMDGDEICV